MRNKQLYVFRNQKCNIMHVVGDYTKISSPPYTKEKGNITLITPFLFRLISPPEQMHVCLRI